MICYLNIGIKYLYSYLNCLIENKSRFEGKILRSHLTLVGVAFYDVDMKCIANANINAIVHIVINLTVSLLKMLFHRSNFLLMRQVFYIILSYTTLDMMMTIEQD